VRGPLNELLGIFGDYLIADSRCMASLLRAVTAFLRWFPIERFFPEHYSLSRNQGKTGVSADISLGSS
jgi:hypothetical protein